MSLQTVALASDFEELRPKVVTIGNKEVAVYMWKNQFYAYLNVCPHQGGPPCEGIVQGDLICEMDEKKHITRKYFSKERYNIICPWHAVEYDLETGVARGMIDGKYKIALRRFETVVQDGKVMVKG